jgi:hypothetical protein
MESFRIELEGCTLERLRPPGLPGNERAQQSTAAFTFQYSRRLRKEKD